MWGVPSAARAEAGAGCSVVWLEAQVVVATEAMAKENEGLVVKVAMLAATAAQVAEVRACEERAGALCVVPL